MEKPPQSRVGVASLTLGLASVVLMLVALSPWAGVVLPPAIAAVALVLGGVGIVAKGRRRSLAILGVVLSLAVLSLFFYLFWCSQTKG